jgi:hypothetical protein
LLKCPFIREGLGLTTLASVFYSFEIKCQPVHRHSESSEGILQEVRRASTYVAFVETDHQTGVLRLFFSWFLRHCADDVSCCWQRRSLLCRWWLWNSRTRIISVSSRVCGSRVKKRER